MNVHVFGSIEDVTGLRQLPANRLNRIYGLYRSEEFESLLEVSRIDLGDLAAFENVLEFISIQCGNWFSRWVCSPATRPDLDAQAEFENWELLWRASAQSRLRDFPDRLDILTRRHIELRDMRLLKYVDRLRASSIPKGILTTCVYWISRYLASTGLHRFANRVFAVALYPEGSVGRG